MAGTGAPGLLSPNFYFWGFEAPQDHPTPVSLLPGWLAEPELGRSCGSPDKDSRAFWTLAVPEPREAGVGGAGLDPYSKEVSDEVPDPGCAPVWPDESIFR